MCLIIHKPKAKTQLNDSIIRTAEAKNPDGFGITFLDNGETFKTMDYDHAWELIHQARPFVAHYRYATVGKVKPSNCHPFPTGSGKLLVYSNGTVSGLGSKKKTDTQVVAEILTQVPRRYHDHILAMTETRFAIVDLRDCTVERHGHWHKRAGIYYSKDNCFHAPKIIGFGPYAGGASQPNISSEANGYLDPAFNENHYVAGDYFEDECETWEEYVEREESKTLTIAPIEDPNELELEDWNPSDDKDDVDGGWQPDDYLAVYGTLKKSYGNNEHFLTGAEYCGDGYTLDRFAMVSEGIPFVYSDSRNVSGANPIAVELYKVPDESMRIAIDQLESHPHWYRRELTDVVMKNGDIVSAWVYFMSGQPDAPTKEKPWISCF